MRACPPAAAAVARTAAIILVLVCERCVEERLASTARIRAQEGGSVAHCTRIWAKRARPESQKERKVRGDNSEEVFSEETWLGFREGTVVNPIVGSTAAYQGD